MKLTTVQKDMMQFAQNSIAEGKVEIDHNFGLYVGIKWERDENEEGFLLQGDEYSDMYNEYENSIFGQHLHFEEYVALITRDWI